MSTLHFIAIALYRSLESPVTSSYFPSNESGFLVILKAVWSNQDASHLGKSFILQHYNDLKHTADAAKTYLEGGHCNYWLASLLESYKLFCSSILYFHKCLHICHFSGEYKEMRAGSALCTELYLDSLYSSSWAAHALDAKLGKLDINDTVIIKTSEEEPS